VTCLENVPGIRHCGGIYVTKILRKLDGLGYDITWVECCAAAFGADHFRARWLVVAWQRDLGDRPDLPTVTVSDLNEIPTFKTTRPSEELVRARVENPTKTDRARIRAAGGGIVPAVARYIGRFVADILLHGRPTVESIEHGHVARPGVVVPTGDHHNETLGCVFMPEDQVVLGNIAADADNPGVFESWSTQWSVANCHPSIEWVDGTVTEDSTSLPARGRHTATDVGLISAAKATTVENLKPA
jgi:hypothetical protein